MSPSLPDVRLLVIADPGLPTRRLERIEEDLRERVREVFGPGSELATASERIPVDEGHRILRSSLEALEESAEGGESGEPGRSVEPGDSGESGESGARAPGRRRVVVLLTEMPRHAQGSPMIAELYPEEDLAVVSCPTLGVLRPRHRLIGAVMACAHRCLGVDRPLGAEAREDRWNRWQPGPEGTQRLLAHTVTGGPRTVAGMVAANDPWRTAPRLSSALAAAAGVGAFGIFYSSIWEMSDALSVARLTLIGVLAVTLMVAWLLLSNRLWDRPVREHLGPVVMLYNLSTVVTLCMCVLALYVTLFLLILLGGLIVIDPDFMASVLGRQPDLGNYVRIAWMSSAMGVVAGALGSSFDAETDLRRLTHGQRERQRVLTRRNSPSR